MGKIKSFILFSFLSVILLGSCSKYDKLVKSNDYDAKYKAAMNCYEKKDYYQANKLFENLATYYRAKDKAEMVSLYYGKSLYGMKDYFSAGYQFSSFVRQFPYSQYAEEAAYLAAYCKYLESPNYQLDQTMTKEALTDFQHYAERYPQSPRIPEVNKNMDELREKLTRKDYETALLYYKNEKYSAATTAFKLFIKDNPYSVYTKSALIHVLRSGYQLAQHSVESKKKQRYRGVIEDFDKFSARFGNSEYFKEAQSIYTTSLEALAKIEK